MSLEHSKSSFPSQPSIPPVDSSALLSNLKAPQPETTETEASAENSMPSAKRGFWGVLRLVERGDFEGSDRTLTALNSGLVRAWNKSSPVGWILARVRCEILKLPPHEYADAHGLLSQSTLAGLESYRSLKKARFNPETIHLLLKGWERLEKKNKLGSPQVAEMLKEAKIELLKVLTRKYGRSVYGVLARWRYEVGPTKFDELSGYPYKTMWQRQKNGAMFDFSELLKIGRSLGFIKEREKPPAAWKNPRVQELEAAWLFDSKQMGRPSEVAQLYKIVEACGLRVDKEHLHRDPKIKLQSVVVEALYRFEGVPWKKIAPLFHELHARRFMTDSEFRRIKGMWRHQWQRQPESFTRRLRGIRDERGLTNAQLAEALELEKFDARKPSLPVFKALTYGDKNKHASFGVLAHLIGRSDEEVESLLEQKRHEILSQWRRQGSTITSPVAVERELWCLDYADLPHAKAEIQKLEWGKKSTLDPVLVVAQIREMGESRVKVALRQLLNRRDLDTVQSAISNLIAIKGYAPLARQLETSVPFLKNVISGAEVPTYPKFTSFLRLVGFEPSLALEVDWREQYARHLVAENRNDLERVLKAYVAEHGTSRRSLLHEKGKRSSEVARFFHWISDAGVVEPTNFAKVLDSLDLQDSHPTKLFLDCVAHEGTVAAGLSVWLRSMELVDEYRDIRERLSEAVRFCQRPRNRGSSIRKMREQISNFEAQAETSSKSSEACKVLRLLPGVTLAEIGELLGGLSALDRSILLPFVDDCRSRGLSMRDLLFSLRDMAASDRRPLSLLERGLEIGIPSAACPPGVLAYLAAESVEQSERAVAGLRQELSRRVEKFKLPGHDAVVEMMMWGVRPEDLGLAPKAFAREVWGVSDEESDKLDEHNVAPIESSFERENSSTDEERPAMRIEIQAREMGVRKTWKALRELIHRRTAAIPWQLVEIATHGMAGKDRAFSEQGGFRIGAAAQFIAGNVMPTPKQLRRTVELAELTFTEEMEWGWSEAYARFLQKRNTAPLGRALLCQIISKEFDSSHTTEPAGGKTLMDNIVTHFLRDSGLPIRQYRRALHEACVNGVLEQERLDALARALGHGPKSPGASLLAHLSGAKDVQSALFSWCERFWNRQSTIGVFLEVGSFYDEQRKQRESRVSAGKLSVQDLVTESAKILRLSASKSSQDIIEARKKFVGITRDEILAAYRRVQLELVEDKEGSNNQASMTVKPEEWVKPKELFTMPLDYLLDVIARRLQDGNSVSTTDMLELLPPLSAVISEMYRHLKDETPWFVAAAAFYRYPDEALREIRNQLVQGKEPKYPSRGFLETHSAWVHSRGDLGKLNSISMRLNFRDPFQAPGSVSR